MGIRSFAAANQKIWKTVCGHVNNAVVFLDDGAAECLHWSGGVLLLFNGGAVAVKDLSSFEGGLAGQAKAVFVLTSCACGLTRQIVGDIIKNSSFRECILITSADESVHAMSRFGSLDGGIGVADSKGEMHNLEQQILSWMGDKTYSAKVIYIPIFISHVTSFVFVTPPFSNLFPLMSNTFHQLKKEGLNPNEKGDKRNVLSLSDLSFSLLPLDTQVQIRQIILNFNSLLEELFVKEELFSLGHLSRIISTELEQLFQARNRRKAATNKVSIIFLDRTLDLTQTTSHDFRTLLDKILCLLTKLPKHTNDVAVDMALLSSSKVNSKVVVSGCLSGLQSDSDYSVLDSMIMNKPKECILDVNRRLVDAVTKCGISTGTFMKAGRVNADTLESQILSFKNEPHAIFDHGAVLQCALAVLQVMRHPASAKLDTLLGIEKALLQTLAELKPSSSLSRLVQVIKDRSSRGLSLDDVIVLLVFLYSLVGIKLLDDGDNDNIEKTLKAVLGDAVLLDADTLPQFLKELIGDEVNELSIHNAVEDIFTVLHAVAETRENLRKYTTVYDSGNSVQPASYSPLVKQIVDDIYDPSKQDLVDLECRTMGLKDVLKSGLGLFMNVSKLRPSDNKTLIIFIVGGTTASEAKLVRETVLSHSAATEVIVGSTKLLSPKDMLKLLFKKDNAHQ